MACRNAARGMVLTRLTSPFSSPPVARWGMTWRTSGGAGVVMPRLLAGLEQLDRIPVGILDQRLPSAGARDRLRAKARAAELECRDSRVEIIDLDHESQPAAGRRPGAVGEGLSCGRHGSGKPQSQGA